MGRVNLRQLRKELRPAMKIVGNASYATALAKFNVIKREELNNFRNNEISSEINEGNQAEHKAGILEEGNLFSFLGFEEGSKPVLELTEKLNRSIKISKGFTMVEKGNRVTYSFPIEIPSLEEIEDATPSPGIVGRSWVREIEGGITGISRYVYYKFFRGGRSKTGLQSRKKAPNDRASGIPYVSELLKNLKERFK